MSRFSQDYIVLSFSFVLLLGFFGNTFILYIIRSSRPLRHVKANMFIFALAVSDMMACILSFTNELRDYFKRDVMSNFDKTLCKVQNYAVCSASLMSIAFLAVSSLHRYVAIRLPFLYERIAQTQKILVVIVMVSVESMGMLLPLLIKPAYMVTNLDTISCMISYDSIDAAYISFVFVVNVFLPNSVILFTNISVFIAARKQIRRPIRIPNILNAPIKSNRSASVLSPSLTTQPPANALEQGDSRRNDHFLKNGVRRRESKPMTDCIETNHRIRTSLITVSKIDELYSNKVMMKRLQKRFFKREIRLAISTLVLAFVLVLAGLVLVIPRVIMLSHVQLTDRKHANISRYSWYFEAFVSVLNPLVLFLSRKEYRKTACKNLRKLKFSFFKTH